MDRLLAEFRVIADHLYLYDHVITTEDLATSGGMRRMHNGQIDITWAVPTSEASAPVSPV